MKPVNTIASKHISEIEFLKIKLKMGYYYEKL